LSIFLHQSFRRLRKFSSSSSSSIEPFFDYEDEDDDEDDLAAAPPRWVHPWLPCLNMRVVHILRKYNPAEWGGTETALQRLFDGFRPNGIIPIVYCPRFAGQVGPDPLAEAGCTIKRFNACVPVLGISHEQRRQMLAVGGNLMSFDLVRSLWKEMAVALIHSHTLGRLGGIALTVAKKKWIPFVVSIHGGVLDLPTALKTEFQRSRGWEWGKMFGAVFRSRKLLAEADAILTCNAKEASLLKTRYPAKRILVQPHGVPLRHYQTDCRDAARAAFPAIQDRQIVLCVGRIDSVKNQSWLIERAAALFLKHPRTILVLAGACTDAAYGRAVQQQITSLGLDSQVVLTGGLPPGDARLIGLFQEAKVVVLPSISETFGLVILEAWAAGTPVISSRTSGATALIQHRQNGWIFDLESPRKFHDALDEALLQPELADQLAAAGQNLVATQYDTHLLAGRMKDLYQELIEEKNALRSIAR